MNNNLGPPASPKQVDLAEMSSEKNVKHERGSLNLKGRGRLHGDVSREKNLLSDIGRMLLFESKSGNSVRVNEIGSFMVESKLPLPVLSPTDPFHEKWDIVMLILITYVAIFAPVLWCCSAWSAAVGSAMLLILLILLLIMLLLFCVLNESLHELVHHHLHTHVSLCHLEWRRPRCPTDSCVMGLLAHPHKIVP